MFKSIPFAYSLYFALFLPMQLFAQSTMVHLTNNSKDMLTVNQTVIGPYEKKAVLTLEHDTAGDHVSNQFSLHITKTTKYNEEITASFALDVKKTIDASITMPNHDVHPVNNQDGLMKITGHFNNKPVQVYIRTWHTKDNPHQQFDMVIDSTEPNIIELDNTQTLDVLSYNTKLAPIFFELETPLNQAGIRAWDIATYIGQYDAIIMQELFDYGHRQTMIARLSMVYPYHTRVAGSKPFTPLTGGVMIFSRWPIVHEEQTTFTACAGYDCLAAKGVAYAEISKNGTSYHLFGTHLQAGHSELRQPQLMTFANFIKKQNIPPSEPVLIAGDFNLADTDTERLPLLKSIMNAEVLPVTGFPYTSDGATNTMNAGGGRSRIDYVMPIKTHKMPTQANNIVRVFRDLDNVQMWNNFDLSDHHAISGHFVYN